MKESCSEDLASRADPEPCGDLREEVFEALDRGMCRPSIEPRKLTNLEVPTQCNYAEGKIGKSANGDALVELPAVEDLAHAQKLLAREPGDLMSAPWV